MNGFVRPYSEGLSAQAAKPAWSRAARLSVIMVVYQTGPALEESVARVLAAPEVDDFVLVDNGSAASERAVLEAAARDPRVTLRRAEGNIGFARGANLGAAAAHGRVLVFLNPDAFIQPGCLDALERGLEGQPSPCVVGARVLNADGTEQRGARRGEITPVTALLSLTRLSKLMSAFRGYEVHHESDPVSRGPEPVPTISGACFAMCAQDFHAMGGFDESYFLHVEDVDLCWRVRRSGGVVLFDPEAEVVHLGSTSLKAPVAVEYHKGVGLARYFRKRADNSRRRLLASLLTPLIIAVSVARPIVRGQAFRAKAGLRPSGAVRPAAPTQTPAPPARATTSPARERPAQLAPAVVRSRR